MILMGPGMCLCTHDRCMCIYIYMYMYMYMCVCVSFPCFCFLDFLGGSLLRNNGLDEVPDPFYEGLFKEAMEAYTVYGRMESIVTPG